jgi:phosphoenolpyruvate carboxykinase (ATP)
MKNTGPKNPASDLSTLGIKDYKEAFWNLTKEELVEASIVKGLGVLSDTGALCVSTGKFTGRAPNDRFIVKDDLTRDSVDWGKINMPFSPEAFDKLYDKVAAYYTGKDVYVSDANICTEEKYRMKVRVVTEYPWSSQFVYNMFLRLSREEIETFEPEWNVLNAPGFLADPEIDGTPRKNFAIINFTRKAIIVGGSGYTGEIKKGVFSVLNFVLPHQRNVLSMHCSANEGKNGDSALFFGLSGTGKTTLSADPDRLLIGDDEHGWSDNGIFNFEGGCYAKTIDLSEESEPEIYRAIKHGAILENIGFYEGTRIVDYTDDTVTVNTRVSYPIYHIENAKPGSMSVHPENMFFLTCDAFGVLPPIARLTPGQAMYHFISGYTAKVAGTEEGVVEPQETFSACFGAPFMPLHPTVYAEMLGDRMNKHNTDVWLINTGWTGGAYGTGSRIKLKFTRAMISAALEHQLDDVEYMTDEVFGLRIPKTCPGVPDEILNPKNTWANKDAYDRKANELAKSFVANFSKFEDQANEEIMAASPKVKQKT